METADKVKKGLQCMRYADVECNVCPYRDGNTLFCSTAILPDAIACIQQLEAERDAAVKAIERHKSCIDCKHSTIIPDGDGIWVDCPKRDGRCRGLNLWEWRGVKEEDSLENA